MSPYLFREQLYKLPIEDIDDAGIQQLYRHVVDNLATKIDMLTTIGTDEFLYNSLKYYGQPSHRDIANAKFLLHAPDIQSELNPTRIDADGAVAYFKQQAADWAMECKIETSTKIVAKAMVNNSKNNC
ncbi:DUF1704 domain-containing protein [Psychrosphaera sp. G1-22]|uniref:DUF1704 domain-containing protein n=1 Tax=Psychrosphaera algicola TaxID=3023714 RepID=A0ABT5FHP5_9GAMM|nr:tyrosine/phenylalanine carboxypeptidase domain-containing protein [Psychrosphaera sp. G1-22]MDC2890719.1 DUF1704 domain-containing protein [Psychrosphaera sp. G1-22]